MDGPSYILLVNISYSVWLCIEIDPGNTKFENNIVPELEII